MHLNGRPRQLRFISFSVWARFEPPGGENKKKTVANVEDVKKDANGRATRTKCCSFLFCGLLRRAKRPGEWDGGLSDMFRLPRPHRRGAGRALIFLFFLFFFFTFQVVRVGTTRIAKETEGGVRLSRHRLPATVTSREDNRVFFFLFLHGLLLSFSASLGLSRCLYIPTLDF